MPLLDRDASSVTKVEHLHHVHVIDETDIAYIYCLPSELSTPAPPKAAPLSLTSDTASLFTSTSSGLI